MITILVEGDGEKRSLPILIQRVLGKLAIRCIDMRGKSNILRPRLGFEETIRRQCVLGQRIFIVLIDGDVTSAPYRSLSEERRDMKRRVQTLAKELKVTIEVCWAVRESESWLVGGIHRNAKYCGLRKVGKVPNNTESAPSDPKQWLKKHMKGGYRPPQQACLASKIDLNAAKKRNHSMRTFLETVARLSS